MPRMIRPCPDCPGVCYEGEPCRMCAALAAAHAAGYRQGYTDGYQAASTANAPQPAAAGGKEPAP